MIRIINGLESRRDFRQQKSKKRVGRWTTYCIRPRDNIVKMLKQYRSWHQGEHDENKMGSVGELNGLLGDALVGGYNTNLLFKFNFRWY